MTDRTGGDTPGGKRIPDDKPYDAPVNTNARRGADYRRARNDLRGALDDLTARGRRLADADPDGIIEEARRLRADSIDIVTLAVLAKRAEGDTWADIAHRLALDEMFVREHYEPIERQWLAGQGIGPVIQRREGQPTLRIVGG